MKKAVASLSKALAARYGITEQKQHEFAMRAVQKDVYKRQVSAIS